jgi:hypothetical protein
VKVLAWVLLGVAVYLAVAFPALYWLRERGYISWPNPVRTDDDRTGGAPGETAQPGAGRDETRSELRRIHTEEDGR